MSRSDKRVPVFGEKARHSQMPEGGSKTDTSQFSVGNGLDRSFSFLFPQKASCRPQSTEGGNKIDTRKKEQLLRFLKRQAVDHSRLKEGNSSASSKGKLSTAVDKKEGATKNQAKTEHFRVGASIARP
ncbi:MAG: hypothetical protein RSB11_02310, partial [Oscillospiraceae bacterium]